MGLLHLERRELAFNHLRFHTIDVIPTLVGAWALVRE